MLIMRMTLGRTTKDDSRSNPHLKRKGMAHAILAVCATQYIRPRDSTNACNSCTTVRSTCVISMRAASASCRPICQAVARSDAFDQASALGTQEAHSESRKKPPQALKEPVSLLSIAFSTSNCLRRLKAFGLRRSPLE